MEGSTVIDRKQHRHPTDVVIDTEGCWRTLYSDGSFGSVLRSIDELLDACALLASDDEGTPDDMRFG
jgi:hypothetical protein